jgi:hypothetical protein
MADPQAQALHIDSNTVRTVQAAAIVGMCLAAGYIIAFGARAGLAAGLTLSRRLAGEAAESAEPVGVTRTSRRAGKRMDEAPWPGFEAIQR